MKSESVIDFVPRKNSQNCFQNCQMSPNWFITLNLNFCWQKSFAVVKLKVLMSNWSSCRICRPCVASKEDICFDELLWKCCLEKRNCFFEFVILHKRTFVSSNRRESAVCRSRSCPKSGEKNLAKLPACRDLLTWYALAIETIGTIEKIRILTGQSLARFFSFSLVDFANIEQASSHCVRLCQKVFQKKDCWNFCLLSPSGCIGHIILVDCSRKGVSSQCQICQKVFQKKVLLFDILFAVP